MRWIFIICFLLASAHYIASAVRPRRDLLSLANRISSKLFGSDTIVLQLPEIPRNKTYQLFKIKGQDNVFLKIARKHEKEKQQEPLRMKPVEPVMVNPEMAIIGTYLGTPTQRETLLALDVVKTLLKSGILRSQRENTVQVINPDGQYYPYKDYFIRKSIKPAHAFSQERVPVYVDSPFIETSQINVVNPQPASIDLEKYTPLVVTSAVKYNPLQTKYSYKQETENGDMTFKSHNNRGVIVTTTNEVPVKPTYVTRRLADIITIGANPHFTTQQPSTKIEINSQQPGKNTVNPDLKTPQQPATNAPMTEELIAESLKVVPVQPYLKETTSTTLRPETTSNPWYVDSNNPNDHRRPFDIYPPNVSALDMSDIIDSRLPFDIRNHLTEVEINKLNKYINDKLEHSRNNDSLFNSRPYSEDNEFEGDENSELKLVDDDRQINSDQVVRYKYSYKQLGDNGSNDFSVIRIEDTKVNQRKSNIKADAGLPQNYIYIPPNIDVPLPMTNMNSVNNYNNQVKIPYNNKPENYSKTSAPISLRGDQGQDTTEKPGTLKTNQNYLKENPIIVPELDDNHLKVLTNRDITQSNIRPHTGGRETNTINTSRSEK